MPDPGTNSPETTNWDEVFRAADKDPAVRREALGRLLTRYRRLLKARLVSRYGFSEDEAEDLLHDFIQKKILEDEVLEEADPERGRFRTFLLTVLERFTISELRKRGARKRRADHAGSLDAVDEPLVFAPTRPHPLDAAWAVGTLADAARRLHEDYATRKRTDLWGVFVGRVLAVVAGGEPVPFEQLVRQYRFRTSTDAYNAQTTVRRRFGALLREVVAEEFGSEGVNARIEELYELVLMAGPEGVEALRVTLWGDAPEMSFTALTPAHDARLLAGLMQFGIPEDGAAEDLSGRLRALLDMPLRFVLEDFSTALTREVSAAVAVAPLTTFADLFQHPAPPAALLELVKQHAKKKREDGEGNLPKELATMLYYASILTALVRCERRQTTLDDPMLQRGARWAIGQPWCDPRLKPLFGEAVGQLADS
jgi:DNA-directed RNA polymerase specialized sigma24 family protein